MFANTLGLIRLILRRDRIIMLLWLVGLLMLTIWFGSVVEEMYPSAMERVVAAEAMKSPAMAAIMGPVDLKDPQNVTIGELYSLYLVLWTAVIIAVMNIFHMVRHTRQEEEQGRIEIVRSLSVGRLSILASAYITALLLNVVIGLGIGVGVAALRIESMDLSSSLLMGAAMATVGMVFAAVTAIFCQLSANSRTALSLAFGYLGFDYILRGVADVRGSELLNWFSPLGIMLRTNSFGHDHWWPILILLVLATALTIIAFWLNASRDVEAGLLPQRAGRSNATRLLSTPIGLAWRLLRGAVIIWAITIPVLGISYGTVMGDMEGFVESNEIFREIFTGDPVQFVSYIMIVITVIGTIPVLQFILKARQQENEGFAENVLVRSASRTGQLTGYFLIALAACFLIPLLNAVGLWLGSTAVMESPIALTTILKAGMVYVPAMLVMLGIAMVLIGLFPRFTSFTWVYLGYSFIVIYFGSLVDLPEWLTQLSPFGFIPQLPTDDFKIFPLMVLVALALLMFVVGFIGYAHRDMDLVA